MATGVSLVTKGMITPLYSGVAPSMPGDSSGGAGLGRRDDDLLFPKIIVNKFKISEHEEKSLTAENLKVTGLKLVLD